MKIITSSPCLNVVQFSWAGRTPWRTQQNIGATELRSDRPINNSRLLDEKHTINISDDDIIVSLNICLFEFLVFKQMAMNIIVNIHMIRFTTVAIDNESNILFDDSIKT